MSIELIVTKSIDKNFHETGDRIQLTDWIDVIASDVTLEIRKAPYDGVSPSGESVHIPVRSGETEFILAGEHLPFLRYFNGNLKMKFTDDLNDPNNPRRQ